MKLKHAIPFFFILIFTSCHQEYILSLADYNNTNGKEWVLREIYTGDFNKDGIIETIKLEECVERNSSGEILLDDGQQWRVILLVEEKSYMVFEDYVQLGVMECKINKIGKNKFSIKLKSPDYVIVQKISFRNGEIFGNKKANTTPHNPQTTIDKSEIKNLDYGVSYNYVVEKFGEPDKEIGSGFVIVGYEVGDSIFVLHFLTGEELCGLWEEKSDGSKIVYLPLRTDYHF